MNQSQNNRRNSSSSQDLATVSGAVHLIEDTKTFGAKGFRKRMVVLEQDNGRFVNYIPLDFVQDGCDSVDELSVGDKVEVRYRLTGRKWQRDPESETKYFLSAEAQGFSRLDGGGPSGGKKPAAAASASANNAFSEASTAEFEDGDVPF